MLLVKGKELPASCASFEWNGTVFELYRHPSLLIPKTVRAWEREYSYAGDMYSIVPYLDRHPCALELKEIYDSALAEFRSRK